MNAIQIYKNKVYKQGDLFFGKEEVWDSNSHIGSSVNHYLLLNRFTIA